MYLYVSDVRVCVSYSFVFAFILHLNRVCISCAFVFAILHDGCHLWVSVFVRVCASVCRLCIILDRPFHLFICVIRSLVLYMQCGALYFRCFEMCLCIIA